MFTLWLDQISEKITERLESTGIRHWDIIALRFGLGFVLIYASISIFGDPQSWVGFVPDWVTFIASKELFLTVHGIFELLLGLALLMGWFLPLTSLIAFLDIASILIFYGIDIITFRDFGLAFMAFALFFRSITKRHQQNY